MLSQSKEEKEKEDNNNNIIRRRSNNTKPLTPRLYQSEAVDRVCEYFDNDNNNRAQIILPCASGKTLISLWIVEKLKSKLTLYLVPSLQLLKQVKDVYKNNSSNSNIFDYICVCSAKDIDDEDEFNVYANLYEEIDRSVTTNPDEIYRFIVGNSNSNNSKIIFSTYQSLDKIVEAVKHNNNNNIVYNLSIADEAHRTAGLFKSNFNLIHDDRNIRVAKRLYMTATPRVVSNNVKDRLDDDEYIYDMSDTNIFGNVVYQKTFKDAIDNKILSDYKILAVGVSDDDIHNYIKDNKQINLNSEYTTKDIANNYALNLVMNRYNLKHSITFHSTIKKARDFTKRNKVLFNNNIMNSYHINGNMSSIEKQQIIDNFKKENNTISTISNARCLSEGVDIPAVDLVYFCDTKNSKIDIIQAIGRALRITKDKTKGYIVVPIYHNNLNNLEEEINISSFERLIKI